MMSSHICLTMLSLVHSLYLDNVKLESAWNQGLRQFRVLIANRSWDGTIDVKFHGSRFL